MADATYFNDAESSFTLLTCPATMGQADAITRLTVHGMIALRNAQQNIGVENVTHYRSR